MALKKKILLSLIVLLCISQSFSQTNFWQQTSGPTGGTVNAIALDSEGRIFASITTSSRIFRSTNNGKEWQQSSFGGVVLCLAVNKEDYIFAGTYGNGLHRSTDHGESWVSPVSGLPWGIISVIAVDSSGDVIAGTDGGGICRSTDNGNTWIPTGITNSTITSIAYGPNGRVYATEWNYHQGIPIAMPPWYQSIVVRSTDGGNSWDSTTTGGEIINCLVVHPQGTIFIGTPSGLNKSSNLGISWSSAGITGAVTSISLAYPNWIFAASSNGLFSSSDLGSHWKKADLSNFIPLSVAVKGPSDVYAGLDKENGVYHSSDLGSTWKPVGITLSYVWSVAINSTDHIFAGAHCDWTAPLACGIYRSTNGGAKWAKMDSGLANTSVNSLVINKDGDIFVGGGGGVYRSRDDGNSWVQKSLTITGIDVLCIAPNQHIFASGYGLGIYRSTDDGDSWTVVDSTASPGEYFRDLAASPNGDLFAGSFGSGVIRSTDDGNTWIKTDSVNAYPSALAVTPAGYAFMGTWHDGMYRSSDSGESWTQINNGLSTNWVYAITYNSLGVLFAGSMGDGVYKSTDNGDSWTQINSGLSNFNIRSITVDSDGYVYAATDGAGVFRSTQSTTFVISNNESKLPSIFALRQNYPNPFNPSTRITYTLPVQSRVTLTMYNILGQVIASLAEGVQEAGSKSVAWNAACMTSGVYFYRLDATSVSDPSKRFSQTRKMVLIK
jgi:photosystem II stability/assembly factor-like uncharacterized protein